VIFKFSSVTSSPLVISKTRPLLPPSMVVRAVEPLAQPP
jgi:hypothetical protein